MLSRWLAFGWVFLEKSHIFLEFFLWVYGPPHISVNGWQMRLIIFVISIMVCRLLTILMTLRVVILQIWHFRSGFEGVWSGRVGGKGYPSFYIYVFFLGILVDTESCTLSITKERLNEITSLVEDWLIRSKCTLKELQSLLGKLHCVSTCVRPGRLFVSRLLTWLKTFGCQNVSKKIPKYVKLDLV